ncbi:hypothetical protein N431DRAFT_555423 [Stipitochalara longipes BDJ]|nr:hypothetical protein N431DRAFT_555423 [Stipitochalara longipes BDJ]
MKRFDNFEKANAKAWDEGSTISYTPNISEVDAPVDNNESLLVDLSDFPSLPQPAKPTPSNTQRLQALHQQNAGSGANRLERAQSQPNKPTPAYAAAQWNTQTQRPSAIRGRGRGAGYANQVNAARHPQNSVGSRPSYHQPYPGQGRGQYYAQHQASAPSKPRAASTPITLREAPSSIYHQNIKLDNHGIGYQNRGENVPGSTERPSQVDLKYGPGRREPQNKITGRLSVYGTPKKSVWAEPEALKTTRRAADQDIKTYTKKEREKYLEAPIEEERMLAYGFYMWPQDDGPAVDVLGIDLAPLRHVRMNEKVYINLVEGARSPELLKISSESIHSEAHIAVTIRAIRSVIAHAKARAVLATPKYFVVPLTASAMRSFIGPKEVITETVVVGDVEKTKNVRCIGTQMLGQQLSEQEQLKWEENAASRNKDYVEDFKNRLSSSLMELAPLKIEMRMRIHFGHIVFRRFPPEYSASKHSIDDFVGLLGHSLARLEIDKAIPSVVAYSMARKIVNMPDRFRPASGRVLSLLAVPAKHTEIFFVKTRRGDDFRVEAEIDARYDEEISSLEEFQVGSYNVFRNDRRDKRIDLSTVDPERQVDFTLQVITDSLVEIPQTSNKEFESLIEGSISKRHRIDSLNMRYPWVLPRHSTELQITKLVMRSVIQYALQSTGFVIEISFYRTWYGQDTREEPQIAAGISMYHPQWDLEMESIENSTQGRNWKRDLSNFFEDGFDDFLNELRGVQELLSQTADEVEQEAAARQAAMELQGALTEATDIPEHEAEADATQVAIDAQIAQDTATQYAMDGEAAQMIAYQVALDLQKALQEDALEEQRQATADAKKDMIQAVSAQSLLD